MLLIAGGLLLALGVPPSSAEAEHEGGRSAGGEREGGRSGAGGWDSRTEGRSAGASGSTAAGSGTAGTAGPGSGIGSGTTASATGNGAEGGSPAGAQGVRGRVVSEQDVARDAVARGVIVPFDTVLPTLTRAVPGDILDARLRSRPGGSWVYEVRILSERGDVRTVRVDAVRNELIEVRRQ